MRKVISIIDDDKPMLEFLGRVLKSDTMDIQLFRSPAEFISSAEVSTPDLVISDLLMPEMNGIDVLRKVRIHHPLLPVVMLTTEAKVETAISAMREGVVDYITKPIDVDEFRLRVRRALDYGSLLGKVTDKINRQKFIYNINAIAGESKSVKKLRELVLRTISSPNQPIWLFGEDGVGKRFLTKTIHFSGKSAAQDLIVFDCETPGVPDLAAHLFGKVHNIHNGTAIRRRGLFERADGGTLALENVEALDKKIQKSIARTLADGAIPAEYARVRIPLNTQLVCISTTNGGETFFNDLALDKDFRKAFTGSSHWIPPLQKRSEDILPLSEYYLTTRRESDGRSIGLSEDAITKLVHYGWPGNVQELFNSLEHAALLCEDETITAREISIGSASWSVSQTGAYFSIPQGLTIKEVQGEYVRQTLEYYQGNLEKAADSLGVSRKTLWEIRRKFQLP